MRTILALLLLLLLPVAAQATPVSVTPTTVVLMPGSNSELVTLTNESDTSARFEITAHAWTETEDGRTTLGPTQDLIVFPALLELPARGQKKIRLGTENTRTTVERNYRLAIRELPQAASAQNPLQIQVLTNMTLPIFVANPEAQAKIALQVDPPAAGKMRFTVSNTGGAHFMLQRIDIIGQGAAGEAFNVGQKGWYVLAGGRRTFEVALGGARCAAASSITVRAFTSGPAGETRVALPPGACTGDDIRFVDTSSTASVTQ